MKGWSSGAVIAMLGVAGCATQAPREPAEVVRRYAEAVRAGDEAAALSLLSPEARARAPELGPPDGAPSPGGVAERERSARWRGERELEVVRTADGWRIRRGVLALFSVDSADGALVALARAIEANDFERVHQLVPAERRAAMSVGVLTMKLERHPAWLALAGAITAGRVGWVRREVDVAEASVAVGGEEHRVVLRRDAEGWKVFDVSPRTKYLVPR